MRVGIIGSGGAGMTAAWLLDGPCDVTVFERNPRLGGHAHTTDVVRDGVVSRANDGFNWFSDALYPTFMRLLELNGVATRIVHIDVSFTDRRRVETIVLPPTGVGPLARLVARPTAVADLLRLNRAIDLATSLVEARDHQVSWGEFVRMHGFPERFTRELLTPMVAGTWGGPYDRVNDFSAYTLMKYFVFHRPSGLSRYPWHIVRDGAASYIDKLAGKLSRTRVLAGTPVTHLERCEDGWTVIDGSGAKHTFDHVIMATGASDARRILRDVRGIDRTRAVLDRFEYYTVRVATHGDPSFMPARRADWRVANIAWDGARSNLTMWVGHESGANVFTSYLGERMPEPCFHVSTFNLPLITPAHYRAQEALWAQQGADRLWFAGDWTRDIGCHEDAVNSAVDVCESIDPALPRLSLLRTPRQRPPMAALPSIAPPSRAA